MQIYEADRHIQEEYVINPLLWCVVEHRSQENPAVVYT